MSTSYSDIIPLIRAAIGDFGIRDAQGNIVTYSHDFHDNDIATVLTLVLLKFPDYTGDTSAKTVTPSLANDNDTGALAYYVAMTLVLPGGTFSMDAPNMKVWVQANTELISHLLGQIKYYMDAGDVSPSIWGALDLYYNEGLLIADRITEAVGNY